MQSPLLTAAAGSPQGQGQGLFIRMPVSSSSSSSSSYGASSIIIILPPPKQTAMSGSRRRFGPIRSSNPPPSSSSSMTVDYSSSVSVFPAEACETVGGEACLAEMYPETKLKEPNKKTIKSSEEEEGEAVDREYLDYAEDPNTVLLDEACDVLGGEFCQPSSHHTRRT